MPHIMLRDLVFPNLILLTKTFKVSAYVKPTYMYMYFVLSTEAIEVVAVVLIK